MCRKQGTTRTGLRTGIPVHTGNSGSFQPEPETQIEIPVPVNKNRIYFSQIPVLVNKNRILEKKFRFKPELTGISHLTIHGDHYQTIQKFLVIIFSKTRLFFKHVDPGLAKHIFLINLFHCYRINILRKNPSKLMLFKHT